MSLRSRLIAGYSLLLAIILLVFGSSLYLLVSLTLTRQIDQALQLTSTDLLKPGQIHSLSDLKLISISPLPFSTSNAYAQVWDLKGNLIASSSNLQGFTEPLDAISLTTNDEIFSERQIQAIHLRILTKPIWLMGEQIGYLQVGTSMNLADRMLDSLLLMTLLGAIAAVGVSLMLGFWITRSALQPLETITTTALQITHTDDLSRRIPLEAPPNSEVGRLIRAFNEALERMDSLFSAQSRFLADISHELRTPLTAIRGNVDLIRKIGGDIESLDAIQSEVDRMIRLVGDLLLLSRAESGSLPLSLQLVEMDTLLLEVFQQARILALGKVFVEVGYLEQVKLSGDRDRLKQLLLNIVSNAVQYTPTGGRVVLSLRRVEDWIHLTVSDTGPGIPKEDLQNIFNRFYRVDRSRSRGALGGAGLGLSIAQYIAQAHHGRIEVASEMGKGTTFSIWLPIHTAAKESIELEEGTNFAEDIL